MAKHARTFKSGWVCNLADRRPQPTRPSNKPVLLCFKYGRIVETRAGRAHIHRRFSETVSTFDSPHVKTCTTHILARCPRYNPLSESRNAPPLGLERYRFFPRILHTPDVIEALQKFLQARRQAPCLASQLHILPPAPLYHQGPKHASASLRENPGLRLSRASSGRPSSFRFPISTIHPDSPY